LEARWKDWEPKFKNYLSYILGVTGVPLLYVICKEILPDCTATFADSIKQTIQQAPLNGTAYCADRVTVLQVLSLFTTRQLSATWIRGLARHRDGCRSMKTLQDYLAGEGNATQRIERAEQLKTSLHYKNWISLKFKVF